MTKSRPVAAAQAATGLDGEARDLHQWCDADDRYVGERDSAADTSYVSVS